MKRNKSSCIKSYFSKIKNEIPLFYPHRKNFLNQTKQNLQLYAFEHSDFTYEDLIQDFGEPSVLADSLITYETPQNIRKGLFLSKRSRFVILFLFLSVAIAVIIILKISGSFATKGIIEFSPDENNNFHIEEDINSEQEH